MALPADSPHGDRSTRAASPSFTPRSGPTSVHAPLQNHSHASVTPSPAASTPAEPPTRTSWRPWTVSSVTTPTAAASPSVDATATMKEAMDQVQKLRLRTYGSSVVTDEINIPPELAKQWIHNYFVQKPSDMFLSLIDKRFVEMMPDMLNFEHIHFDSCLLVIYYGVLWHGCCSFMERDPSTTEEVKKWVKLTYLGCLRAVPLWQREATGTITDMVAAITMARVAAESFDYEMAWQMFKTAGEYAKGLGMHNLDRHGGMMRGIHNPDISDDDRKSFWDLIQVDMFFRLIFNKPPAISGNAWQVNLPWLNPQSQPPPQPDTTMIFLVSSRVTLLLIRFFAMLEESTGDMRDIMARTEDMCREIQRLYEEWNLVRHPIAVCRRLADQTPRRNGPRRPPRAAWRRGSSPTSPSTATRASSLCCARWPHSTAIHRSPLRRTLTCLIRPSLWQPHGTLSTSSVGCSRDTQPSRPCPQPLAPSGHMCPLPTSSVTSSEIQTAPGTLPTSSPWSVQRRSLRTSRSVRGTLRLWPARCRASTTKSARSSRRSVHLSLVVHGRTPTG